MPGRSVRGGGIKQVAPLALMPAAAFAVHQLRYWFAFGAHAGVVLRAQGHSYLHSVAPWVTVQGAYHPQTVPPYTATEVVDGYRFQVQGHPKLAAIQATFLTIHVTGRSGQKAVFGTWRGALAHAIFIHAGSLDYFHTHVCSPGAIYCTSVLGALRVTGNSSAPGVLHVGVLLPEPGTWRMLLLTYLDGHHVTAPFTLNASA